MKNRKPAGGIGSQRAAYLFILPSFLVLTVFVFVPLISSFIFSLLHMDIFMNNITFAGLDNFRKLFTDSRVSNATFNTFYFTLLEVPLQVILALLLSTFISRSTPFCRTMRSIYYVPFICSMTAVGIVFSMLLDPNMGAIPYLLRFVGLGSAAFLKDETLAMPTIIVISAWKGFGYTVTLIVAAMLGVSGSLYEAAEMDGAGYWKKFFKVTVPEIWPTISFCIVTNTIGSLQMFDQAYIMTKGGPTYHTETLVQYVYDRGFQTAPYELSYASAISVYLFFLVAVITFVLRRFALNRKEEEAA